MAPRLSPPFRGLPRIEPLHIPDGFLSLPVALGMWLVAAAAVAISIARLNRTIGERQVPMMGVMAAFIFAAQMINFPVAGGTSGHLLGGALAAILLGRSAAIVVMTAVIVVQALLFQDGGLLAMGANITNMGVLTALVGWGTYRLVRRPLASRAGLLVAGAIGGWLSVMVSAGATALELAASGTSPLEIVLPAMLAVHAAIGIGEGAITAATLAFVAAVRPDLVPGLRAASTSAVAT